MVMPACTIKKDERGFWIHHQIVIIIEMLDGWHYVALNDDSAISI